MEEAGVDGGGLYREFLLFGMENFVNSLIHLFSASCSAFFGSFPAHILAKEIFYYVKYVHLRIYVLEEHQVVSTSH